MSNEKRFTTSLEKVERLFTKQPGNYKFRVGLLAALGYGYIIFSFCFILSLLCGLRELIIATSSPSMASQINWLTFLVSLSTLRLFIINIPKPKGIDITREQVPNLFNLIDELTTSLKAPEFQHIILDGNMNAGVLQRPRFGFFGASENYLILGLPLMQALSLEQFEAVVAHELAHLSGNHSRFSSWIYRLRRIWSTLAEKHQQSSQRFFSPYTWFFNWYSPFFQSYSFALARENEYYADSCAANWVGSEFKAEALINLNIKNYFLQEFFWTEIYQEAAKQASPPEDTISQLLKEVAGKEITENATVAINLALVKQTDKEDTHPCLRERLERLDYQINWQSLPQLNKQGCASYLFGDRLEEFATALDQMWCQQVAKEWQQLYFKGQQQKENFTYLLEKAAVRSLTIEESYKVAYLTEIFQNEEKAITLYQDILKRDRSHSSANYQLGRIYLANQDSQGIKYLKQAIQLDPALAQISYHLLSRYYQQLSQVETAENFLKQGNEEGLSWQKAIKKRQLITDKDEFLPHLLPQAEIRQLSEQLGTLAEVKTAYLVRKQVKDFPNKPFYILGISRQFVRGRGESYQHDEQFAARIKTELNFSQDFKVIIFSGHNFQLRKKIHQVKGAAIYY
ncbi:MAG: M48 family metalloprotease [Spirulinaceae cyanobacterium]